MKIQRTFLIPFVLAAVLTACGKSGDSAAPSSTPTPAATAAAPAATAAPAPAPASTPAAAATTAAVGSADSVGVPECDDYISKVEACVANKVPEAQRTQMESAFKMQRDNFKQLAANPQAKAMLASQCTAAVTQAKTVYAAYGCSF